LACSGNVQYSRFLFWLQPVNAPPCEFWSIRTRALKQLILPRSEYNQSMKVKTSVTLPSALLAEIDRLDNNRSAFLERAAVSYIGQQLKSKLDAQDAAILDRVADELNQQSDVLEFQGLPK